MVGPVSYTHLYDADGSRDEKGGGPKHWIEHLAKSPAHPENSVQKRNPQPTAQDVGYSAENATL